MVTPPPSATPFASTDPGVPWKRYVAAIWRYKWLVVVLFVLGVGAGLTAARRIRPTYEAHATLWVSDEQRSSEAIGRAAELVNNSSWIDLLRSYTILERAAKRAGLYISPGSPLDRDIFAGFVLHDSTRTGRYTLRVEASGAAYTLVDAAGQVIENGTVGDSVGRRLGFSWQPPVEQLRAGSEHMFTVRSLRDAATDISSRLTTVQPEGTNFIRLTLSGSDPVRTAALLNMITDEFTVVSTDLKKRSVVAKSNTLREQTQTAQQSLQAAEGALERFRVSAATLPSDAALATARNASGPILNDYLDARTELDGLQRDRDMLQDVVTRLRASANAVDYVLTLPRLAARAPEVRLAVQNLFAKDTALESARRAYTDLHATVRSLQAEVDDLRLNAIPRLVSARLDEMARRQRELQTNIGRSADELHDIPPRTLEELRLRRNVSLAENLFAKVQGEYESAELAEAGMIADVSVLDHAEASAHAPTNRALQILALCTMFGGFGGIGLALLLDTSDKRLRYTEQVRDDLDLWILGIVPRLRRKKNVSSIQSAQLVEALRSTRVSVAYALGAGAPVQLTITSPNVGDGKSLVAANLAISFAEAGYQTLLIDGDIRRGTLHGMFGVPRRPGLLDCLASGMPLLETIAATGIPNLSLLPCGTRYRQGPEMLAGSGLSALVAEAKTTYDVVIVDSPPLGVGSDALWECVATGAAVIVLRLNASDRKLAVEKLAVLDRLPVQVLGAILNDCPVPEQDEYSRYLSHDMVDVDTAIPQRASQIGLIGSGAR